MLCPKCGNPVQENAAFCGRCGEKLEIREPQKVKKTNNRSLSKMDIFILSGVGLVVLASLLAVIVMLLPNRQEHVPVVTPAEIANTPHESEEQEQNADASIGLDGAYSCFRRHYLSYLEAINAYDTLLITDCTSEMKQYAGYKIENFNKGYTFDNIGIWVDLDSVEVTETEFGLSVVFFAKCENLCYRRDSGKQVNNNTAIQRVQVYYYSSSGEWLVQDAVVKKEYSVGGNLLAIN